MLPLPNLSDLLGALHTSCGIHENSNISMPWKRGTYHPYWFSRSYWSLAAIAAWRKAFTEEGQINFWVPDYFCNQSLAGVREMGVRLIFYSITEAMKPDWGRCESLAIIAQPHLFLLVHYFGVPGDIGGSRIFCQRHNAIFIEDCAHILLPMGQVGNRGDFVIYSPHKQLPLPDGALLLAKHTAMEKIGKSSDGFVDSFEKAITLLPNGQARVTPWIIKKVLRKMVPQFAVRFSRLLLSRVINDSTGAEVTLQSEQSVLSKRLIERQLKHLEAYGWCRRQNAVLLEMHFQEKDNIAFIIPSINSGFPYMFGLRFTSEEMSKTFRRKAQKSGCPVSTWPDLPPEVLSNSGDHIAAIAMQRQTVFLPVHHSLRARKLMRRLGEMRKKPIDAQPDLTLCWDVPIGEWERVYRHAPRSHLLQSRAYAEAMQGKKKWIPRFGAIVAAGEMIAVLAVLEKRGPMGTVVARLNRGPVWLSEEIECETQLEALRIIAMHYAILKGRLLFVAPNVPMSASALQWLNARGFRRRLLRPWSSIWLDLRGDLDSLRKSIDGKWRNQLVTAEKKNLQQEISDNDESFEWMIAQHGKLLSDRGFEGPSPAFVRQLRTSTNSIGEHFYVLRASYNDQPVACIALVTHGTSATYLLGWNGDEGRRVYANNFLVWQAVLFMKEIGCAWFDLGGINEWLTPGITAFKRGLRGQEYRLVGEYINLGWGRF